MQRLVAGLLPRQQGARALANVTQFAGLTTAPEVHVVSEKLVRPQNGSEACSGATELSPNDRFYMFYTFTRAWGFKGSRIDPAALEAALQATVTDLPFLAGRLAGMQNGAVGGAFIKHTGEGAALTVAEGRGGASVDAMGADRWPASSFPIGSPPGSFYTDYMHMERDEVVKGQAPLLRLRLSRLADGDILALNASHVLMDGKHTPRLVAHLAARYRQAVTGEQPRSGELLCPTDRRLLSAKHMAAQLGVEGRWEAAPELQPTFRGIWHAAKLHRKFNWVKQDDVILHIPQQHVEALKRMATGGNPAARVSTGDAVQAASAMLQHAARGQPLLPVAPAKMMLATLIPAEPPGFFGNSPAGMAVTLPESTPQPASSSEYSAALQQLAAAIRQSLEVWRTQPAHMLRWMHEKETMEQRPVKQMVVCYEDSLRAVTCYTNYMPRRQQEWWPDLGLGRPTYDRESLPFPRIRNVAYIRPAAPPYSEGLFVQLALEPRETERLRRHPLLHVLLPGATIITSAGAA